METEIKLAMKDLAKAGKKLEDAGFAIIRERVFERNIVLDDGGLTLRNSNRLLRVREAGGLVTCTFKGPEIPGLYKQRDEREFTGSDSAKILAVFDGLGFTPRFRYEKHRTEYRRPGEAGTASVDETPIGCFMELEGEGDWIDRTAQVLGFDTSDYITASYSKIYLAWCEKNGIDPGDFVFAPR